MLILKYDKKYQLRGHHTCFCVEEIGQQYPEISWKCDQWHQQTQ